MKNKKITKIYDENYSFEKDERFCLVLHEIAHSFMNTVWDLDEIKNGKKHIIRTMDNIYEKDPCEKVRHDLIHEILGVPYGRDEDDEEYQLRTTSVFGSLFDGLHNLFKKI